MHQIFLGVLDREILTFYFKFFRKLKKEQSLE